MTAKDFTIPVIDFEPFRSGSEAAKEAVARDVVNAFKEVGFIYIKNHGVDDTTISNVFTESSSFFALHDDVKEPLAWRDPRANRGFTKVGRERVTNSNDREEVAALRKTAPDCKESFEIGLETDPEFRNHWPPEDLAPNFRLTMIRFYDICHKLHVDVMRAIALGLGLGVSYFDPLVNESWHTLRLLNYPPVQRQALDVDGQARANAHSDYGSITLLFQDDIGGLEVQNPHTQEYVPATPIPGTIVVNVADLLARWSNDILRSTIHRVVAPTPTGTKASSSNSSSSTDALTPKRQSVAFFCNPNAGAMVSCLPGCEGSEGPKYPEVNTGEYLAMRLRATYD